VTRAVRWSDDAIDDIEAQVEYIGRDDPVAARRIAERIIAAGDALGEMATGHHGRMDGTYEKLVRGTRYIVVYSLEGRDGRKGVAILRVIHASRDWPEGD
jgi:plasmid stabilization system protein ParE